MICVPVCSVVEISGSVVHIDSSKKFGNLSTDERLHPGNTQDDKINHNQEGYDAMMYIAAFFLFGDGRGRPWVTDHSEGVVRAVGSVEGVDKGVVLVTRRRKQLIVLTTTPLLLTPSDDSQAFGIL